VSGAKLKILTDGLWRQVTRLAKMNAGRAKVAVAYFGSNGSLLLPLREGSFLVVNAGDRAVRSGQTNPSELLKLHKRGVRVHSVSNLHSKVFVFGETAVISSANVSNHSRDVLVECGVLSEERSLVRACTKFVNSLLGDELGPDALRRLIGIYRPPKFEGGRAPLRRSRVIKRSQLWVVRLRRTAVSPRAWAVCVAEEPRARARLNDRRRFEADKFFWEGPGLARLKENESLVSITHEIDGRDFVSPPGRVLRIRPYVEAGVSKWIIFVEQPRRIRRKSLAILKKRLSRSAKAALNNGRIAQVVRDHTLATALYTLT
jgi:hypothetical protein